MTLCAGAPFACSSLRLHINTRRFIYLIIALQAGKSFWSMAIVSEQPLGLLVSLAANSLKDSSVETLFALFHFNSFSLPPAHYPPPSLLYPPLSQRPVCYSVLTFLLSPLFFSCLFFGCKYNLGQFNVSSGSALKYFCVRMKGITRWVTLPLLHVILHTPSSLVSALLSLAAKPQTWQVACWVNWYKKTWKEFFVWARRYNPWQNVWKHPHEKDSLLVTVVVLGSCRTVVEYPVWTIKITGSISHHA